MQDWFEWNGVRSTDYGIYVTEQPPPTIPSERATFTNVPGRSGSLTKLEGDYVYDDIVLSCTCVESDSSWNTFRYGRTSDMILCAISCG